MLNRSQITIQSIVCQSVGLSTVKWEIKFVKISFQKHLEYIIHYNSKKECRQIKVSSVSQNTSFTNDKSKLRIGHHPVKSRKINKITGARNHIYPELSVARATLVLSQCQITTEQFNVSFLQITFLQNNPQIFYQAEYIDQCCFV